MITSPSTASIYYTNTTEGEDKTQFQIILHIEKPGPQLHMRLRTQATQILTRYHLKFLMITLFRGKGRQNGEERVWILTRLLSMSLTVMFPCSVRWNQSFWAPDKIADFAKSYLVGDEVFKVQKLTKFSEMFTI